MQNWFIEATYRLEGTYLHSAIFLDGFQNAYAGQMAVQHYQSWDIFLLLNSGGRKFYQTLGQMYVIFDKSPL